MYDFKLDVRGTEPPEEFKGNDNPVPVGNWVCLLTAWEQKPIKNDKGWGFSCEFTIADGPHKGRKCWPFFSYGHVESKTAGFAQKDVSALAHATGVMNTANFGDYMNIPVIAYWGQEPAVMDVDETGRARLDENNVPIVKYKAKNTIRGFKALARVAGAPVAGAIAPTAAPVGNPNKPLWAEQQIKTA